MPLSRVALVSLAALLAAPVAAAPPPGQPVGALAVSPTRRELRSPESPRPPGRGGRLGLVPLPSEAGIQVLRPERAWGTPRAVELLREVAAAHRRRFPDAPPLLVGDLSRERGGRLAPHASHRRGRDADLRLPQRGGREHRLLEASPRTLDLERAWFLIEQLVLTGEVQYIFLDYRLQRALRRFARDARVSDEAIAEIFQYPRGARSWIGIVRHEPGHRGHLHVRFRRPLPPAPEAAPASLIARAR